MGLKSKVSKRQILLTCAALTFFSYTTTGHAGFEWVPKQQAPKMDAADMAVQEAPVTPVANENLDAPKQQMMEPAPNSGMVADKTVDMDVKAEAAVQNSPQALTVKEGTIKTMSFAKPAIENQDQKIDVILPAPVQEAPQALTNQNRQAKAISVQQLDKSETHIDLPANTAAPETSIDNAEMENTEIEAIEAKAETPDSNAPISLVPEKRIANKRIVDEAPIVETNMIEPFPVQSPRTEAKVTMAAPQQPAPTMAHQPVSSGVKEVVHGFGKDMPLALAIQQIVPEDRAFSFSKNVDVAQRVEWNGGQSWDVVLRETLWPLNLDAHITDNKVVVYNVDAKPEKTSAVDMPTIEEEISAVEPAAGTEIPESSPAMLMDENSVTLPPKRSVIQDPGEMEQNSSLDNKIEMKVNTVGDDAADQMVWQANKGDGLKSTLFSWSEKTNMQIIWEASHDYTLEENFSYQGDAKAAFTKLLEIEKVNGKDIYVRYIDNPQNPADLAMVIVQDNEQAMKKQKENQQAG